MKKYLTFIFAFVIPCFILCQPGHAQGTQPGSSATAPGNQTGAGNERATTAAPVRVLGEVTAIEAPLRKITVTSEQGKQVVIIADEKAVYRRVPAGETTLDKAVAITFDAIGIGDRLLARGRMDQQQGVLRGMALVVINKTEIDQKKERDRAEWLKRGVLGVIASVNPQSKEITLRTDERAGGTLLVVVSDKTNLRRYAPDSVKFKDSTPGSFDQLKVGDHLRALGEKSGDDTRYAAEEIVSGKFITSGGIVTAINEAGGEVKINDVQTKQPLTIVVSTDTMLRRLTPEAVQLLVDNSKQKPSSGQPPAGGGDLREKIETSPSIALNGLKVGDAILVLSPVGKTPARVTGVLVASGVDKLIKPLIQQPPRNDLNLGLGLPNGSLP